MDKFKRGPVDYQEELEQALKARELFLKQYPDLQSFQQEIDLLLAKMIGPEDRLKALAFLIEKKLYDLNGLLADLQAYFELQYGKVKTVHTAAILHNVHSPTEYLN
jgi:hypothetical protein